MMGVSCLVCFSLATQCASMVGVLLACVYVCAHLICSVLCDCCGCSVGRCGYLLRSVTSVSNMSTYIYDCCLQIETCFVDN